ncbi:MAG: hypothetical protein MJ072_04025, partial [Clostridia bacterium]|nr:hypothetical protein [Clostridia bacterium]
LDLTLEIAPVSEINNTNDATIEIESYLSSYKVGETFNSDNDGYFGIPYSITTYYDVSKGKTVPGCYTDPDNRYTVNTALERIGTDSDVDIIRSMLERGYIVEVLDYKNNPRTVKNQLEASVQKIHPSVNAGKFLTDENIFTTGTYYNTYFVPAGYDISIHNVFWSIDKHGADGTFEEIIHNWNTDFKTGSDKDTLVKWVRPDGTRKKVSTARDGSSPEWFNVDGTKSSSGQYTKVKYTVAEVITDCVNPDGSLIPLDLLIDVTYPTHTEKKVPVMLLDSCSQHLSSGNNTTMYLGFLTCGYACANFDYGYIPMLFDISYGWNSQSVVTGDGMGYTQQLFNDKRINTAAVRYMRYLAMSDSITYNFDIENVGMFGHSKGGWFRFLGEEIMQTNLVDATKYTTTHDLEVALDNVINSFQSCRVFTGHHDETRYQNGKTASSTTDGFVIRGGELQPWLTCNGEEVLSGVQFVYASNGEQEEDMTEGHVPMVI